MDGVGQACCCHSFEISRSILDEGIADLSCVALPCQWSAASSGNGRGGEMRQPYFATHAVGVLYFLVLLIW